METSYLIAQLFGGTMFVFAIAMIFNQKYYTKLFKNIMKNEDALFISGFMALPAGIALVTHHNVWAGPWWVVVLTVLCWAVLVKGALLFIAPEWMQDIGKSWIKNKALLPWIGLFYLAVGMIFGYYGFFY